MEKIEAKNMSVTFEPDFREIFVDGPMSVSIINNIVVLTFSRARPNAEAALKGAGIPKFEMRVVCRVSMPERLARDTVNLITKQLAANAPAGRA